MLGPKGLTQTEATRVANFIKEQVKNIDITVEKFAVITETAVRDGENLPLDSVKAIEDWKNLLLEKAKLYSLSAWLKEGVKLKESFIALENCESFCEETVEGLKDLPKGPVKKESELKNFLNTLTTKEVNEYYENETIVSHVGKFIHNFDTIRNQIDNYEPTTFKKISPTETVTVKRKLVYDKTVLLNDVVELTSVHREAEKKVNYYHSKFEDFKRENLRNYLNEKAKYDSECSVINNENNALIKKALNKFEKEKIATLKELKDLKIVIPNEQQELLNSLLDKLK